MNVTNKKSEMRSSWYDVGGEQVDSPKSKSNKGCVCVCVCVCVSLCVREKCLELAIIIYTNTPQ